MRPFVGVIFLGVTFYSVLLNKLLQSFVVVYYHSRLRAFIIGRERYARVVAVLRVLCSSSFII